VTDDCDVDDDAPSQTDQLQPVDPPLAPTSSLRTQRTKDTQDNKSGRIGRTAYDIIHFFKVIEVNKVPTKRICKLCG
jgi:hypothetical protein